MNEELRKPILLINRQNGHVDMVIKTKKEYVRTYAQICELNDVATAIKVWCDYTNQTKRELLRDFTLVELINTFSTRYMAQVSFPRKAKKNV
jgi:hypothetical protein